MTVCEAIYSDPRHNDRNFSEMMAQCKKEEIQDCDKSHANAGRKSKYASMEERREIYNRRKREKRTALGGNRKAAQ